ncbi:hypothetical protein MTBBW1_1990006 [Desulfamplus magnetovallimortis]|uniref:Uncharacterized protein n=1 Tax=Desulfamplus magnetovallimortis TaxID=1246637 RepID=A0A1W1HBI3_9BACT|nr:hypothetical protein MTBBW1_1990006 [Desulfamplus magnetovallimortis]
MCSKKRIHQIDYIDRLFYILSSTPCPIKMQNIDFNIHSIRNKG